MENKTLKKILMLMVEFCVLIGLLTVVVTENKEYFGVVQHTAQKNMSLESNQENSTLSGDIHLDRQMGQKVEIEKKLGDTYIKIAKHSKNLFPVNLHEEYLEKSIMIDIYNMPKESIALEDIVFVKEGRECRLKQQNTELSYADTEQHTRQARITLTLDQVYGYELYEDEQYVYIDCCKPKEVYEHVVVLDAGHGGKDTGSDACLGKWSEKDYNLDIVQKIENLWDWPSCKLYVTRREDKKVSLQERVNFANQVEADWFISIHCNSSDEIEGTGLEALCQTNQYKIRSKTMAEACLEQLSAVSGLTNRGVLDGDAIYIIRNAKVPTVLLEMGFMTDKSDLAYLQQEENRNKMAETVYRVLKEKMEE